MESELLFYLFVIIGVLVRTLLPYLKKKAENPETPFDPKFGYTAILAIITAYIELAAVLVESPYAIAALPPRLAILTGFFFGMGNNEIWNRILHRRGGGQTAQEK